MPAKKKTVRSKGQTKKKVTPVKKTSAPRFALHIPFRWLLLGGIIIFAVCLYLLLSISKGTIFVPRSEALFSGRVTELSQDLHLLELYQKNFPGNPAPQVNYYSAGTYQKGVFKGYERIVALVDTNTPLGVVSYLFATQDQNTYTIDTHSKGAMLADGIFYPGKQVTQAKDLPTNQPQIFSLDKTFALYRQPIAYYQAATGKKDQYGNTITIPTLLMSLPSDLYTQLDSPVTSVSLFAQKKNTAFDYLKQNPNSALPQAYTYFQTYSGGTTEVLMQDNTGLVYRYSLSNPANIASHDKVYAPFQKALETYTQAVVQYNKQQSSSAAYPQYPSLPQGIYDANVHLNQSDISSTQPLYSTYNVAFPHACGMDPATMIAQHITDSDVTPIGSASGMILYALQNPNHPLYQLEYFVKISSFPSLYWQNENTLPRPSYEEYVARNPLLLLKDYWGRWVVLGEYDYKLQGGCGKPVMYFYPKQPTEIHVSFVSPMQLNTAIPSYVAGWHVLAHPDGILGDLQQQFTLCNQFKKPTTATSYAYTACTKNTYPYIFWAGQSLSRAYPTPTTGWVIKKSELATFFSNTLTEIGFTQKEKTDMLSYWVPQMFLKNAPYYRISFLQTKDMNTLVPLAIQPVPESTFRLFLDWSPVQQFYSLPAEQLDHVIRNGFTFVEWGGLEQ